MEENSYINQFYLDQKLNILLLFQNHLVPITHPGFIK